MPGTAQTPLPGTAQTPPGTADSSLYNIPTGGTPITPNEYNSANENDVPDVKPAQGRPSPYMVNIAICLVCQSANLNNYPNIFNKFSSYDILGLEVQL